MNARRGTGLILMNACVDNARVSSFWSSIDREISVHYFRLYNFHCLEHIHGEFSINIPLGSPLAYRVGDTIEHVAPGSTFVIQPGEWHTGVNLSQGLTISVSERSIKSLCSAIRLHSDFIDKSIFISRFIEDERLKSISEELAHEMHGSSIGRSIVITSLVTQYLIYILRGWAAPSDHPRNSNRCLPVAEMLRAVEYMNDCPKSLFSLQSISKSLCTSQSRFTSLFAASTGSSPLAFYNRILIQKAQYLLAQPDMSVKEVAFNLEFQSEAHFCNLFRSISGASPTEFRSMGTVVPLYTSSIRR